MNEFEIRPKTIAFIVLAAVAVLGIFSSMETVPKGHVAVADLWGDVQETYITDGFHWVNPFLSWTTFDVRKKEYSAKQIKVPTQDKQVSKIDITVKYRLVASKTPEMLVDTGDAEDMVNTHLIPKFRSLAREVGKSVETSELLFRDDIQANMQVDLQSKLESNLTPLGITIEEILIRNIELPDIVQEGIDQTIVRRQEALRQKEELERFTTEQEQKVRIAEAEFRASELEADQIKLLADAKAYEIEAVKKAVLDSPAYIQLIAMETLGQISKDPASKLYFLNGDSPQPLPLMHLGEQ